MKCKKLLLCMAYLFLAFSVVLLPTGCKKKKKKAETAVTAPVQNEQPQSQAKVQPAKPKVVSKFATARIFNYVPTTADQVQYVRITDFLEKINAGKMINMADGPTAVFKEDKQKIIPDKNAGELIAFLEMEEDRLWTAKAVLNLTEETAANAFKEQVQDIKSSKSSQNLNIEEVSEGDFRGKPYVRVLVKDEEIPIVFILIQSETYQLQYIFSNNLEYAAGPVSIAKTVSPLAEKIKDDDSSFALIGNINKLLPVIGRVIPHNSTAKFFRAMDRLSVKVGMTDKKIKISFQAEFLNPKLHESAKKAVEGYKELIQKVKDFEITDPIAPDTIALGYDITQTPSAILESILTIASYSSMSDLEKIRFKKKLKREAEQEKKKTKTKRARGKSSDASSSSGEPVPTRRPGQPVD